MLAAGYLHVDQEREGEVLVLPEDGRQGELHPGQGGRAGGQREGELHQPGHGGDGQLAVDVSVGVQGDQAAVVSEGEDVGAGDVRTQTLLDVASHVRRHRDLIVLTGSHRSDGEQKIFQVRRGS